VSNVNVEERLNTKNTDTNKEDGTNGTLLESDTSPEDTEEEDMPLTEEKCTLTTESITTEWLTTIRENT